MNVLLVNQFGGDSSAPTGRILAELGQALQDEGHRVVYVTRAINYGASGAGTSRALAEAWSHVVLFTQALNVKADIVISMTTPACLAVTAGLISWVKRAKHYHWLMDLYPDVGVRLGALKEGSLVTVLRSLIKRAYHRATVVSLDADMQAYLLANYGVESRVIEPLCPDVRWPELTPGDHQKNWLYSGNFGRAHEIAVLLEAQKLLESRGVTAQLVLQGHGAQFESSRYVAAELGLKLVVWRDPVPMENLGASLLSADVLVVTRRPEAKGLLLPSKLVLAELSGRAVLWIGDTDGATAQRLRETGRHGVFRPEDAVGIADWLEHYFARNAPHEKPRPTAVSRAAVLDQWKLLLKP